MNCSEGNCNVTSATCNTSAFVAPYDYAFYPLPKPVVERNQMKDDSDPEEVRTFLDSASGSRHNRDYYMRVHFEGAFPTSIMPLTKYNQSIFDERWGQDAPTNPVAAWGKWEGPSARDMMNAGLVFAKEHGWLNKEQAEAEGVTVLHTIPRDQTWPVAFFKHFFRLMNVRYDLAKLEAWLLREASDRNYAKNSFAVWPSQFKGLRTREGAPTMWGQFSGGSLTYFILGDALNNAWYRFGVGFWDALLGVRVLQRCAMQLTDEKACAKAAQEREAHMKRRMVQFLFHIHLIDIHLQRSHFFRLWDCLAPYRKDGLIPRHCGNMRNAITALEWSPSRLNVNLAEFISKAEMQPSQSIDPCDCKCGDDFEVNQESMCVEEGLGDNMIDSGVHAEETKDHGLRRQPGDIRQKKRLEKRSLHSDTARRSRGESTSPSLVSCLSTQLIMLIMLVVS